MGNRIRSVNYENTLFVPDLSTNLFSVAKIINENCGVIFKKKITVVKNKAGDMKLIANKVGNLDFLHQGEESARALIYSPSNTVDTNSIQEWHK